MIGKRYCDILYVFAVMSGKHKNIFVATATHLTATKTEVTTNSFNNIEIKMLLKSST